MSKLTRTEKKFMELVDEYWRNLNRIDELSKELKRLNSNDLINAEVCLLCELLGFYPDMADRAADALRAKERQA